MSLLKKGKSPVIDGLPVEFYATFWSLLGDDLLQILSQSITNGLLPNTGRKGVITLLPKHGDSGLIIKKLDACFITMC